MAALAKPFSAWRYGTAGSTLEHENRPDRQREPATQVGRRDRQGAVVRVCSKDDNFPHLVSGDNPRIVDKASDHLPSGSPKPMRDTSLASNACSAAVSQGPQSGFDCGLASIAFTFEGFSHSRRIGVGSVGTLLLRRALFLTSDNEPLFPSGLSKAAEFRAGASWRQAWVQGGTKGRPRL